MVLDGEILGPESEQLRAKRVKASLWSRLKGVARQIPFTEDLLAAYYCPVDPQTPRRVRATLLGAVARFALPFGPIPRVVARFGFADRVSAVAVVIATISAHITPARRAASRNALAE
jgi:uncharacterized membrane protein YkvA (DUF1232 family)